MTGVQTCALPISKMAIGTAIGSAALGGLTGVVGGLVSGAIGGLGSLMGIGRRKEKKAREAEEREHQRQLEYMGLQAQYNREQAKYSTELSKEMWDYTNFENQVKHLKEAGLNPALLYGQGGGGGSAAGGGNAAGVGLPSSTASGAGKQQLQLHDKTTPIDTAQITVAAAQAKKLEAEADNLNQDTKRKKIHKTRRKNYLFRRYILLAILDRKSVV